MRNLNEVIISGPNASTQTSIAIQANQLTALSCQVFFTDTTVGGTLKIQASNDIDSFHSIGPFTPTHWADIPTASVTIASGASGLILVPVSAFQWIRAVWTPSVGGSGSVVVQLNAQGV